MKSLSKLQRHFKLAVTTKDKEILEYIKDNNPKFSPAQRLESYRYAISARLEESLIEDFPLLARALGEEAFTKFLEKYLLAYPSITYNLSEVGLSIPTYLAENPIEGHPYAKNLAEFEVEKLYSDNSEKNPECLAVENISQEDLSAVRLIFDNSARLFESEWTVLATPVTASPTYILIYEIGFEVKCMELKKEMFATLKNLFEGQSLPQAAAHLSEDQAPAVSELFSELVRLQIVIGYERKQ
jgi:hypothetical protein